MTIVLLALLEGIPDDGTGLANPALFLIGWFLLISIGFCFCSLIEHIYYKLTGEDKLR